nr:MAG TPA: hypothetical protein [Caudoviricetes sp.]
MTCIISGVNMVIKKAPHIFNRSILESKVY